MSAKKTFFEGSLASQMLGPLLLIPVLMLAGRYHPLLNFDLLIIAGFGLILCATRQMRGCLIALGLLVLSALIKHCCIDAHHLFQVCLECSLAFSLLITALISQEAVGSAELLQEQMTRKAETIQFLEEDIVKQREKGAEETALHQKKLLENQEQIEELQKELSALQILNEVLRKSTAQALVNSEKMSSELKSSECRTGLALEEIDSLQKELSRVSNTSDLAEQNRQLFHELNAARYKEMQTHLINETLARMLAVHTDKTQECEQLQASLKETQNQLLEKTKEYQELKELTKEIQEQGAEALAKKQQELQLKTEECISLAQKNQELQQASKASEPIRIDELVSKKMAQSEKIESLHKQLQAQFILKDLVLQQTRSQLFHTDTELQRLQRELSEKQIHEDPLPPPLRKDWESLEEEKAHLLEENTHLTELVTHLMASSKKKVKTARVQKKSLVSN